MKMWRRKRPRETSELNMTAMCDVIFQLLIYLILTAAPAKVLCTIDTARPEPDPTAPINVDNVQLKVLDDAYVVNGKRLDADGLKNVLLQLARMDKEQTVSIACSPHSSHGSLIRLLDVCSESGLNNFALLSL